MLRSLYASASIETKLFWPQGCLRESLQCHRSEDFSPQKHFRFVRRSWRRAITAEYRLQPRILFSLFYSWRRKRRHVANSSPNYKLFLILKSCSRDAHYSTEWVLGYLLDLIYSKAVQSRKGGRITGLKDSGGRAWYYLCTGPRLRNCILRLLVGTVPVCFTIASEDEFSAMTWRVSINVLRVSHTSRCMSGAYPASWVTEKKKEAHWCGTVKLMMVVLLVRGFCNGSD